MNPAVQAFLDNGSTNGSSEAELAAAIDAEMIRLVQHSLTDALAASRILVKRAKAAGRPIQLAAQRALGRAALMSASYAEAEAAYRTARDLARNDKVSRGRIDRTLIDVYMYLGNFSESKRRAGMALKTFEALNDQSEIAKTNVNYANVLHRQDRHRDAEGLYRDAADHFASIGEDITAARCWFNRANTLVQLFEFDEAAELYRKARDIYRRHDCELDAVDAEWGLSWLHMLEGKFHIALQELADCEEAYRRINVPLRVASCELDRAEVYLNLNLFSDALDSARHAEKQFRRLGIRYETSKAALYLAQAAYALNKRRIAGQALHRAEKGFRNDRNYGFLGASQLLRGHAARTERDRTTALRRAFENFKKAQLPLWQAICDLQLVALQPDLKVAERRLEKNPAVETAPHLYARWQTTLGDRAASRGDRAQAKAHWEQAANRLDLLRSQLPPVELRSSFSAGNDSPHTRLIQADIDDQPRAAAVWSERYKTAGIWSPLPGSFESLPARRRVEQSLDKLARQYAALSRKIFSGRERLATDTLSDSSITELRRRVHLELSRIEQPSGPDDAELSLTDAFTRASRSMPVVQFHVANDHLVAFVHQDGETRAVQYRDGRARGARFLSQWQFLLESAALADYLGEPYDVRQETRLMERLGDWLWAPLELTGDTTDLLILPEGDLSNLPWWAIRHGGHPLIDRHRFVQSPSLRHYLHAKKRTVRSKRINVFIGEAQDLHHVPLELDALTSLAPNEKDVLIHERTTRRDWPSSGSSWIWHFAGHALLNQENPFYSSLRLTDGPLFAADFRTRAASVGLVTLAACQSGAQVSLPGEESTGLVRSLLEMGARNVVAGHWPVADKSTAHWMTTFYRNYFRQEDMAEAARTASATVKELYPSAYHWAAFCLFGAGS